MMALRLDANRAQKESREMVQIRGIVAPARRRLREGRGPYVGPYVADGSNLFVMSRGGSSLAAAAQRGGMPVMAPARGGRLLLFGRRSARPTYGLADELFYRSDSPLVAWRDDRNCRAASSCATRATDAMDVVVRVVRDIEIEDVTDIGNIEAPRRDV
jgi:hypothetical protein